MRYRTFKTPAGRFSLIESDAGELLATWDDPPPDAKSDRALQPKLSGKLVRYFRGDRVRFDDVPLPAGTPFQRRCWRACRSIPPGRVITYGELAAKAGSPAAARAAGQAMKRNPLPVIVPCHRVVGTVGLHGYGGSTDPASRQLDVKRSLLALERAKAD